MTLKLHTFVLPKPLQFFGGCPEDENDAVGLPPKRRSGRARLHVVLSNCGKTLEHCLCKAT
jgi:hypothetical protein